jgi:hypothetical protein
MVAALVRPLAARGYRTNSNRGRAAVSEGVMTWANDRRPAPTIAERTADAKAVMAVSDAAGLEKMRAASSTNTAFPHPLALVEIEAEMRRKREAEGHDGETLAEAKDRFWDNLEDPFDEHKKSRGRKGWKDTLFGHSLVNVAVSWAREDPYSAGHWLAYAGIAIVVLLIGWAIFA